MSRECGAVWGQRPQEVTPCVVAPCGGEIPLNITYVYIEFWCCFFFFLALNLKSQSCNTELHPSEHETHWLSLQFFPSFSLKLEEFRSSDLLLLPSKHFVILNMLFLNCKLFAFPSHVSRSICSGGGSSVGSLVHRADDWFQCARQKSLLTPCKQARLLILHVNRVVFQHLAI